MADITTQDQLEETLLAELDKHFSLTKKIQVIMATQQQAADQIAAFATQLGKVNSEIQQKIADLTNAAANTDNVSPELQNAIDALAAPIQALDDIVPDAPAAEQPPVVAEGGDTSTQIPADSGVDTSNTSDVFNAGV